MVFNCALCAYSVEVDNEYDYKCAWTAENEYMRWIDND